LPPFTCSNPADDGNSCDDGVKCNGAESCSAGTCNHAGNPCGDVLDNDSNCVDACNEATGSCDAPVPDDTPCNDQRACTLTDVCRGGLCIGGDPQVCNRLDQCHATGTCDDLTGQCTNPLLEDASCVVDEKPGICDADGECQRTNSLCGTAEQQCPLSSGPCCTDTCRLRTDGEICGANPPPCRAFQHCNERDATCPAGFPPALDATPCDDGNFCNGVDSCSAGACTVHSSRPAGVACQTGTVAGACDGAGNCVAAVCGNGKIEAGEDCDGEECCTSTCRFKGPTEPCGIETRSCHEQPLCNGREATCPDVPRLSGENSTCSDDNECTDVDTCHQGECIPGKAICGATAELRKNGKKKVAVLVGCESDKPAECEATLLAAEPTTSTTTPGSSPALSEIVAPRKAKLVRFQKSALGFRTVLRLRLNSRGRELIQNQQVDARLEVTVVRGDQQLHPPATLLRLLQARR